MPMSNIIMVHRCIDGIQLVVETPAVLSGYKRAVLTPNVNEYDRLCAAMKLDPGTSPAVLSKVFGGVTIVRKGQIDVISDGERTVECTERGCPRRCGGQGDVLAGAMGTFLAWHVNKDPAFDSSNVVYALGACMLTRKSANIAYMACGRSTTTLELLKNVGPAFKALFESDL
eukprot:TRINITY_DN2764_c0_g1_i1.p1 TRINITY_DN2764_c0_g1~~TRINITY_DN2764_c0_g1_i1.p1  ORF type:complete len:172 (-),score=38.69 TRINITY_DN2764_c0_g1_i1:90-605(-)